MITNSNDRDLLIIFLLGIIATVLMANYFSDLSTSKMILMSKLQANLIGGGGENMLDNISGSGNTEFIQVVGANSIACRSDADCAYLNMRARNPISRCDLSNRQYRIIERTVGVCVNSNTVNSRCERQIIEDRENCGQNHICQSTGTVLNPSARCVNIQTYTCMQDSDCPQPAQGNLTRCNGQIGERNATPYFCDNIPNRPRRCRLGTSGSVWVTVITCDPPQVCVLSPLVGVNPICR